MMNKSDVLIIGGGLAGLTAAIHLSKSGMKVTLIEKNEFPKHKVCGEYISNEVLPYLEFLDIDIESLNPVRISKVSISTVSGKIIHGTLPLGGFGISRYALDELLYKAALSNGCDVVRDTVKEIFFDGNLFHVTTKADFDYISEIAIGAYGKRSNIDHKISRSPILKKSPWLAVKAHYSGSFTEDLVAVHNFNGGYCGVSNVENGIINICYLVDYKTFKKYKSIEDFQEGIVYRNPHLKTIFERSKMLYDKPLTISQISFAKKPAVENHILMTGDTAGLIHPLCGNGMAMAIHSAKIASELILEYSLGLIKSRAELEANYTALWNFNFKKRITAGRILAWLFRSEKISAIMIRGLIHFPVLFEKLIQSTHGKPIVIQR